MLIDIFALKLILKVFIMRDYVIAACIHTVVSVVCHCRRLAVFVSFISVLKVYFFRVFSQTESLHKLVISFTIYKTMAYFKSPIWRKKFEVCVVYVELSLSYEPTGSDKL